MIKCGKGCMPECQYFTTCGCVSPFNCPYKIETGYINSATSTLHNEVIEDYKHRAEVAERALRNLAQLCAKGAKYYLQSDKAVKERERELYDEWINNAEKEISEEKKND